MAPNRDNFTKKTIDILAKRVGYLCSNPTCRTHTVGPNENVEKATIIGEAAHITAAASGGPRFENSLEDQQRIHPNNGIWLCSICAKLIDRNPKTYTKEILLEWKQQAENEMQAKLNGIHRTTKAKGIPYLEADLICGLWGRSNRGFSDRNPTELYEGQLVMVPGPEPIIFWDLWWKYSFIIHNNSSFPAFNIEIENIGETKFTKLSNTQRVNNLPPFQSIDLDAEYNFLIESSFKEADIELKQRIPNKLNGLSIKISYLDEDRNPHSTIVKINDGKVQNYIT
jgi:hypothetical protein